MLTVRGLLKQSVVNGVPGGRQRDESEGLKILSERGVLAGTHPANCTLHAVAGTVTTGL